MLANPRKLKPRKFLPFLAVRLWDLHWNRVSITVKPLELAGLILILLMITLNDQWISHDKSDQRWKCYTYLFIIPTDAVAFSNAHFGTGIGAVHLHVVGCTGRETNLTDCPQFYSHSYCFQNHSADAGVRCQGLINGTVLCIVYIL